MNKNCIRLLLPFLGLAGLATAAHAQEPDQLIVKIPYEFVVAGKTLPPGNYRVNRANSQNVAELVITSFENRVGVLVFSSEIDEARDHRPSLSFQQDGDKHVLVKIETEEHTFAIPVTASPNLPLAKNGGVAPSAPSGRSASR
jgi:hypothetical protein